MKMYADLWLTKGARPVVSVIQYSTSPAMERAIHYARGNSLV